jgi:hypothetical protein
LEHYEVNRYYSKKCPAGINIPFHIVEEIQNLRNPQKNLWNLRMEIEELT